MNKSCQSLFIPGAVLGTNDMDLKLSATAELLDFDHPLVKTRLETQVGAFSYIPHPKAPAAAGSHGDPAPCLSVSSLVLFHLNTPVSMWHSPPFIRR